MIRKAKVAGFGESWVNLRIIDEVERSQSCDRSMGCNSSRCGCRVSGRPFKAAMPTVMSLKPGDTVEVSAPIGIAASLLILGLPVLTAAALWFVTLRLLPGPEDGLAALAGFIGLFGSAGLIYLAGGKRKGKCYPEIISILKERKPA
ncbi:MAG: hypothetical protein B6D68_00155 [spirochete symbiont of Stewartia floridana]|nr:MAG: hypothetical protein B6D68_00155 [spirochete symbiont of Stewartia floridana]